MTLSIHLLGTAEISHDNTPLQLKGNKPLALLAYLLITGKPHTRQHLVDLLYDEADDPRRSLRWTLNQVRSTIGSDYIVADRRQIGFNFDSDYWLDVDALTAGETDLYRGEFLEGVYIRDAHRFMDWAFFQRERLRKNYEKVLTEKLITCEKKGQYEIVINIGHQLIQLDNLREEWYRALMQAYALLDNRDASLNQYEICRKVLAQELKIEPDEETKALYEQIQAGTLTDPRSLADLPVNFPLFLKRERVDVAASPAFVARERELERLDQFLGKAFAGQAQLAFVIGGAGRGKTTLLTEFVRRAHINYPDLIVATGTCNAYAGIGDPYLPFRDVMEMLTGDVESRLTAGAITYDQARRLWANLLPACQTILDQGPGLIDVLVSRQDLLARTKVAVPHNATELRQLRHLSERKEAATSGLAQEYLFQQLTNVLQTLATRQPLLLLLDDLHWADATSIGLLFHLGRRLGNSPILVVGTYRPEEVALGREGKRHPLEKVLAELKQIFGDVWIDLGQTGETEGQHFVEAFLDVEANQLDPAFRQTLYQHTGGHPLFTVELLRAMQERGDLIQDEQGRWREGNSLDWKHLPDKAEAVVEERIGRLEDELREILTVASVDGEEFTAQVVAQVQAVSERRLLGQLSQTLARKHRLVRDQGEVQAGEQILSRYQFAHALFQRYLYDELSPGERRLLHGEIGRVLEMLYGEHSEKIAVQLAWHFQEANIPEKARQYLRLAGEQAARQYANDEAITYFSQALELLPEDVYDERYNFLLSREKVYDLQGDRINQEQDLALLHNLTELLNDDQKRAEVALRQASYDEAIGDYAKANTTIQKAIKLATQSRDKNLEATGHELWGRVLWHQGDHKAAQSKLEQSLALARSLHLIQIEADSLRNLGIIFSLSGNQAQALDFTKQALSIYHEIGNYQGESQSLNNLGVISKAQGYNDKSILYNAIPVNEIL